MSQLGFGIVGPGFIAGVIADAIAESANARLTAVSSRRIENARQFTAGRQGVEAVQGADSLLARPDVDAVYIATPTVAKEEIALAAIAAGKHVLVDKPFVDHASVLRMTKAAAAKGVLFMDATHFVHHPRTAAFQAAIAVKIGTPRSLHTAFYFPFSDRSNIRFDPTQEPMTALGDMAWYSMRAVVEYLRPEGRITQAVVAPERESNAIVRASGLIAFEGGQVSTFDVGYTAGTILMDLQLLGTTGVLEMDDFVLDWESSSAFKDSGNPSGYSHRTGMATRKDVTFIPTPSKSSQEAAMIDDFAELAASGTAAQRAAYAEATLKTQEYLDALWAAAGS
ncbi:Predicted dehydrogenase [Singulisphaera sp. GP187]|uniref:Gfo/Idh/MocA family protein n=1 Tax=Singulisphaera sp. GP187 TaxID=1882752 RepID=UPI00092BB5DF|nr:Gfo/Idh/MocA family oxidoreductase [Singulisphaera sp. GP187]SIN69592.1 Predicted dehydrogenase [Singulisphaera sp. GP187]